MLQRYKKLSVISKSIVYILFSLLIIHASVVLFCFNFSIIKRVIITCYFIIIWFTGIIFILYSGDMSEKIRTKLFKLPKQVFVLSIFFVSFFVASYISSYTKIEWGEKLCVLLGTSVSIFCISGMWSYLIAYESNQNVVSSFLLRLNNDRMVFVIIIVTIITRVGMLDTLQRWDAGEYYYALGNACGNFNLSWSNFFDGFRLCNHTTLGYSFIMSIGEFLNPRGIIGVMLVNLILTVWAFVSLYKMLKKTFEDISSGMLGLIVIVSSVIPFILGGFGYLTPDYVMLITFILAICSEYNKSYLLQFFWLCICLNTKESAIFAVFGYFLFKLIALIGCEKNTLKSNINMIINNPTLWVGLLAAITFIIGLCLQGGFLWKGGTNEKTIQFSSTKINSFGLNWDYILFRIKQHFVLNFSWLFTLFICVSIVYMMIKKMPIGNTKQKIFIYSISGYLLFFLLTNCIFITAGAYRYAIGFLFFYGLLALLLFGNIVAKKMSKKVAMSIIVIVLILNSIESFIHIDPVSKISFETRTTGNWYTVLTNYTHNNYGNDLCNNRQYAYLDQAIDKLLDEIDYRENCDIVMLGGQQQGSQINGNGKYYRVCWDKKNKKRIIYDDASFDNNDNLVLITYLSEEMVQNKAETNNLSSEAYAVFIPYYELNEKECLKVVEKYYNVEGRKEVAVGGISIGYYKLILK